MKLIAKGGAIYATEHSDFDAPVVFYECGRAGEGIIGLTIDEVNDAFELWRRQKCPTLPVGFSIENGDIHWPAMSLSLESAEGVLRAVQAVVHYLMTEYRREDGGET